MLQDMRQPLETLKQNVRSTWGIFDPDAVRAQIAEKELVTGDPDFWNDRERAERTMTEIKRLRQMIEPWEELIAEVEDTEALLELAMEEGDDSQEEEIRQALKDQQRRYDSLQLKQLLSDDADAAGAFLTIHSGAGGTEACDWVSMLYRMYRRWIDDHSMQVEVVDLLEAEGGIKSVTLEVKGDYAFGYLKAEAGVHRLVRISPYDSSGRRHTSFASVYVSPVIDDTIDVDLKMEDVRVDTYRASGAGGQHVNKTDSAVRMTHNPTGIVVQCQNERSQHKNRAMATTMLKSRLYEYYRQQQEAEQAAKAIEKKDISWGNQIRSYVFQPYTMVKDLRTSVETGNVQAVMDGDLDQFIEAFLKFQAGQALD
ncbi:peptide chain release factor 2 [Alkalispirochaeta americana]|uniref:peptide chain release factor 2 n=1 Tax=Alkalispirochaeta americana TaxID=159291 RepID=UPI00117AE052|nr:peptide chain release factor 2 [Alkalispirochaeta americana]